MITRRAWLRGALGALALGGAWSRIVRAAEAQPDCWLTPEETAGPFWFDPKLERSDITEHRQGVPLKLALTVVGPDCAPLAGATIDLWHCDKDGLYSGYAQPDGDTEGETFLRGHQVTDARGAVRFRTIWPGWYPGRATHIHFKAHTGKTTYVTSQFAFLDRANDAVYRTPAYRERGPNPTRNARDFVFHAAEPRHLLLEVAPDGQGGYEGAFRIGVDPEKALVAAPRRGR